MEEVYHPHTAIFAAGCFWGVQFYFDQVPGVIDSTVGYTGGRTDSPTYEQVCHESTGHAEAVLLHYNPQKVSFSTLLKHFFRMHDPTQLNRQGPDIGDQYRSAVFYLDEQQRQQAEAAIAEAAPAHNKPLATRLEAAGTFWEAEAYHQKFTDRTGRGMCHIPYKQLD